MDCPLDYSLCCQTVTCYGLRQGFVRQQVFRNALYQYSQSEAHDRLGKRHQAKCLLVIPGQPDLQPGDRVYPGEGPAVTRQQWAAFLPATVPGLCQISTVTPCFFDGVLCHTEAT